MDLSTDTISLVVAIVVGLSGWLTLFYSYFSNRPKIRGRILQVMTGKFTNPEKPDELLTSFTLFLYLTNTRKSPVHLVDYELSIDVGRGPEKLKIVRSGPDMIYTFVYLGRNLQIPNFQQRLLYRQAKPISYGTPFIGFLLFGGEARYHGVKPRAFKLVCTDVFGHKHRVNAKPEEFRELPFIEDMFGVQGFA